MRKTCRVQVNGAEFFAERGEVLLEAALANGIEIAQGCEDGGCGACRVRLLEGLVYGGEGPEPGAIHACRSRIVSDLKVAVEQMPRVSSISGRVLAVAPLSPDVVEVEIEPSRPLPYLPGQCVQVQFRGYPARYYSPTFPLQGDGDGVSICLHVRRIPDGRVSGALGADIAAGHRVQLRGPFGAAYLRAGLANRLVLVAGSTGFAPIWSIAEAALGENPNRRIFLVVGARTLQGLYMVPALCRLARFPNVVIVPVTDARQTVTPAVQAGPVTDYVPKLSAHDIIHAAGAPPMVAAVARMAEAAGALCFAESFLPQAEPEETWLSRTLTRLRGGERTLAVEEQSLA
ncbi:MAG TPA: 2Fe-2S iron-sulfur cluster binding domain-containing protein [Xanthobacteraceae bacterium]|jgi:3-phenylpropionate/trans-cinnamate dioxygenase ferredoxin reductase subunit|nr:2Fe-2S iron-sulfur cluster binding domain-containing protein [Xanthobacteraceae bacterium]